MSNEKEVKKVYKPLVIVLYVYDVKTEKEERKIVKTIDSEDRRAWLQKTLMWALLNGKYITILNVDDDND